jgi:ubiquitin C-terminal hydrolase
VSPNVLILILNRGKDNKFDVKLNFTETIDITEFVSQREMPKIIYNLYGVITHIGESGPNAHFIASCKSPIDGLWYKYNDAIVSVIKNFMEEVVQMPTPYILFYQRVKQ